MKTKPEVNSLTERKDRIVADAVPDQQIQPRFAAPRFLAHPLISFPGAGQVDCLLNPPFTPTGTKNANVTIRSVELYIGDNDPPPINASAINNSIAGDAGRWSAVFGDINDADDLPNNSNCRLIIHFTEVNQSGRVGRRFTHVVPAAMVQFEHDPDSNHRVKIDGTAENSDDVVATVFGPSTSPSVVLDNIYNSSSREFHFSTIPTTESTVKVVLTCTSVRGENVDFPFILPVDQVGPTFTPGSIDEQINGNELKWETNAQDTDSKFSGNATDVTVTIVNSSGALVNVSEYDVDVTPLLENTVLNIKVKLLNKTHLTADLYTITIRARDIAGNESPISDEFDIT